MTTPHLTAPSSSAAGTAASPSASFSGSQPTAPTFGPGSRGPSSHNSGDHGSHRSNSNYNKRAGGPPPVRHDDPPASSPNIKVIDGPGGRVLCVSDVRGNLEMLNIMAHENRAQAIIHTGDFGFYEVDSFDRISDRTLRHLVQYSTLLPPSLRTQLLSADANGPRPGPPASGFQAGPPQTASCKEMRSQILAHPNSPLFTQFPLLLTGAFKLRVPVYTVWGACEDVRVLEKIRTGEYAVDNLHVLDEASTSAIEVGGIRLRLFGLGGAVVLHKLFDNGEGAATIAGGQGTMWTTILQIGELIDTAQKCYDQSETRVLITHTSPGREGLLIQLALALKADLTISAGLHFRYGISYNEFSVQSDTEQFRRKLLQSKAAFGEVWDSVRSQVEDEVDDQQRVLLNNGLAVTNRVPSATTATGAVNEDPAWKNTWNWNLPDAAFGHMTLDIREGRISTEMKSVGFSFANRRSVVNTAAPPAAVGVNGPLPSPLPVAAVASPPVGPARGVPPTGPQRGPSGPPAGVGAGGVGAAAAHKGPLKSPRTPNRPRPPMPPQSQHPPLPTQQQATQPNADNLSFGRPALSKGPRGGDAKEDKKGNGEATPTNGTTAAPAEGGLTASASNQSVKSNKSKSNRKKSTSGWSSKSEAEKSADEREVKSGASQEVKADGGDEDKREGGRSGGNRGRGSGRGRGGGGRGGFSRGGSATGGPERRKPSGPAEGTPKEATPKPAAAAAAPATT